MDKKLLHPNDDGREEIDLESESLMPGRASGCMGLEVQHIVRAIKDRQDLEPPSDLLDSVMRTVATRKIPWRHRLYRWVMAPRTFTFTPLQAAPALMLLLVIGVFFAHHALRENGRAVMVGNQQGLVPVRFTLNMPEARSVALLGSFNSWHASECRKEAAGWTVTVQLPTGRYEYAFLVDGARLMPDPQAGLYQDDGFGNRNAVLIVGNNDEKAI